MAHKKFWGLCVEIIPPLSIDIKRVNAVCLICDCGSCRLLTAALEVTQRIMDNKEDWSSLFKPSDFFQKYKYVVRATLFIEVMSGSLRQLYVS